MKKFAKSIIVAILGWQVRRLSVKHTIKVIAVAGSVGKTSTKYAIASVLQQKHKVRFQEGNYNDPVSVPLIFFGQSMPSLLNPFAWLKIIISNELQLHRTYSYEYVVVELGTDGPGQLRQFNKYLDVDIGVLTAIAPEHMEFFATLDDVATEELTIAAYSKTLLVNKDLCEDKYLKSLTSPYLTYALNEAADYRIVDVKPSVAGYDFTILKANHILLQLKHELIAETQLYSVTAATAVADVLDLTPTEIDQGIRTIKAVSGRMQKLIGVNNSIIIDDTYNASPVATKAALKTLYNVASKQRIAILGSMNELGKYSASAHREIGEYCQADALAMVVTIGHDANMYLAPAALAKGCQVKSFDSPYDAGEYLKYLIKPGAVILAKGSQNGVFAEETVKILLANPVDAAKLVRQSEYWIQIKLKDFHHAA